MTIPELIYTVDSEKKAQLASCSREINLNKLRIEPSLHERIFNSYGSQKLAFTHIHIRWADIDHLQSIMLLHILVPSLQRVNAPSASNASTYPMHSF